LCYSRSSPLDFETFVDDEWYDHERCNRIGLRLPIRDVQYQTDHHRRG